jgi:hypothetical protein
VLRAAAVGHQLLLLLLGRLSVGRVLLLVLVLLTTAAVTAAC